MPKTLFDKLWDIHAVGNDEDGATLLAVDRVMLHERTGGVALRSLLEAGRRPVARQRIFAVMDHIISFREGRGRDEARSPGGDVFITETRAMADEFGINLVDTDDAHQGIVHVIAPELGIAHPGVSLVCPDSHTCSLGALGALAIGVGSSVAEHAMATGVMRVERPAQMRIAINGALRAGVTAKDVALHIIGTFGTGGAKRRVVEYAGEVVRNFSIEERLTLCNLAVEFAAFTAVIAPDEKVFDFVKGKPHAPSPNHWPHAVRAWSDLRGDDDAEFDQEITIDGADIRPMVSWGTSPEQCVGVDGSIPSLSSVPHEKREQAERAMAYMKISPDMAMSDLAIKGAFIGSCTNGRLSDLAAAARILRGRKVAPGVRAVCVPGSKSVRRAAEAQGLDKVFRAAGFEWGEPGCAMCFYAGGETFPSGARVISSTNRNFEGRQGPGVRTHLASPATVAASAVHGRIIGADTIPSDQKGRQ